MNPRKLGLQQFPEEANVFEEFVKTYKKQIGETYSKIEAIPRTLFRVGRRLAVRCVGEFIISCRQ